METGTKDNSIKMQHKGRALSISLTITHVTVDSGFPTDNMEKAHTCGLPMNITQDNGNQDTNTAMEKFTSKTAVSIEAFSCTINYTDRASTIVSIDKHIEDNGSTAKKAAMESSN